MVSTAAKTAAAKNASVAAKKGLTLTRTRTLSLSLSLSLSLTLTLLQLELDVPRRRALELGRAQCAQRPLVDGVAAAPPLDPAGGEPVLQVELGLGLGLGPG